MKIRQTRSLVLSLILWLSSMCVFSSCSKRKPMNNLATLKREYLDALFLAKPHLATFIGDRRFDDRWADLSPHGLDLRQKVLGQEKVRLTSIDKSRLRLDEQVDVEIMSDGIELELLYLAEIRDWEWDPRLHDSFPYYDPREMVASRISDIIHGDFASLQIRLRSLLGLLQELPTFLKQIKDQLKNPARVYTEQAIEDNKGRIELLNSEVAEFIRASRGVSESLCVQAEAARNSALQAVEDYQKFLEQELLPRSSGDWRLGADRYRKKFPLALQTNLTPESIIPKAEGAFKKARLELFPLAVRLHKELFPQKPLPKPPNAPRVQNQIIRAVKDELSKDHPKAEDLVEAHRRNLDDLRGFITMHDLLELPPKETLIVREMPLFKRGVAAAEYLAPGVLESKPQWQATYYVDPIDPSWNAARLESYLRANNRYEVQLTAMHEAYPGHHTQYYYSRRNLNPLRAVLWNAPFVEGWAVYGENLMIRLGYGGNQNARYEFFARRGDMIVAANILMDIQLHCGRMSPEEAMQFMVEEGFQEQAQAEKKLLRAKLDSTQLAQYFLGYDEILGLESDYRILQKDAFNQRAFDEALIGQGSIAVRQLRKYLLRK
ncbi:MAG: hypothetical protein DMG06_00825 [Acidobacteria bacterium]|nr:MAG: hypothetical protein DMG06_00825 [Acidobacteriota bacterium]